MADLTDRYLEGTLSPAQARELAQSALDQPDLFDDLTFQAVAQGGLVGRRGCRKTKKRCNATSAENLLRPAQRELAQAALQNDELFDALAAHGAMETSLTGSRGPFRARAPVESAARKCVPVPAP